MERVDCHSHTAFSGHGKGTVAETVSRARDLGLTTFVQTEHLWLPAHLDPQHGDSMSEEEETLYRAQLEEQRDLLCESGSAMELVIGCELDWLPDELETLCKKAAPYEYVLGSVHFVDGLAVDYAADVGAWPQLGVDETWKRYLDQWLVMTQSDLPITAFAHPDLPKKYGEYPSFDLKPYYKKMAEAVYETDAMVEVNTAGLRKDVNEMYPTLALLEEFCRAGIACTVGSDAHAPNQIASCIEQAYDLMVRAGYRQVTVPMSDGGRRCIDLEV